MNYARRKSDETVLICPGAVVVGDVTLEKGVSIWYNAVLRGDEGAIFVGGGHQHSGRCYSSRGDPGRPRLHHRPRRHCPRLHHR